MAFILAISVLSIECGTAESPEESSWKSVSVESTDAFSKIVFANDQVGYIIGFNGTLLKTNDGGTAWEKKILSDELIGISVFSPNSVYVIGTHRLFKSTNGGTSWTEFEYSQTQSLESIYFINELVAIRGLDPDIYRSVDGGATWSKLLSAGGPAMIDFSSSTLGYIYATNKIYKTTDGGQTWNEAIWNINIPAGSIVTDILFISPEIGFVLDHAGGIYKTTDGGTTWSKKTTAISSALRNVAFFDTSYGLVVGDDGVILFTSNTGESWGRMSTTTTRLINSVVFLSKDKAFAVGFSGTILKYH